MLEISIVRSGVLVKEFKNESLGVKVKLITNRILNNISNKKIIVFLLSLIILFMESFGTCTLFSLMIYNSPVNLRDGLVFLMNWCSPIIWFALSIAMFITLFKQGEKIKNLKPILKTMIFYALVNNMQFFFGMLDYINVSGGAIYGR